MASCPANPDIAEAGPVSSENERPLGFA